MSKGKKVTIGYRYRLGFHLVLCQGGADEIIRIRYEDREAWTGNVIENGTVTIDKPNLFGGDKKQGGLQGDIDFMFGNLDQPPNSYLIYWCNKQITASYLDQFDFIGGYQGWVQATGGTNFQITSNDGVAVPAYRGVVSLVFKNFMYGAMTPYLKPFRVTVRRVPKTLNSTTATITIDGRKNANPAHIIYDVLTNAQWGQGVDSGDIYIPSFTAAAAALASEGFGLSILWTQEGTADEFINLILSHISASLYPDPATGQYTLKLLRNDYTISTLLTLDETNVLNLRSYQRTSTNDLTNELTVEYFDPDNEQNAKITVQNLATLNSVGKVVRRVIEYPGIRSAALAARVAQRDLLAFSTPLAKLTIEANLTAWNLRPGDVFKFSWAKLGISSIVFRVMEIEYGALRDNKISITAVEDIFSVPSASYIGSQAPLWTKATADLSNVTTYKLFDAPYYTLIQHFGEDYAASLADNRNLVSVVIPRANGLWTDFQLHELISGSYIARENSSFSPFVTLNAAIGELDYSLPFTGNFDLDLVTIGSLGVIDNEWITVTAKNSGFIEVTRGVLDTIPVAHSAGAILYLYGDNYILDEDTDRFAAETVTYKFQPRTGSDELLLSSATARSYTLVGRQQKPYPPGNVRINSQYFPASAVDYATVTWAHRDRTLQTVTPVGWTTSDIGPETGVTYTITFYVGATTTVVNQAVGLTTTTYTGNDANLGENSDLRVEIKSVKGTVSSLQTFSHRFIRILNRSPYALRVLSDSAIGYWRMGEGTGSVSAADYSISNYSGTISNVALNANSLLTGGDTNTAFKFNGTSSYVAVPHNTALVPTAAVSVEVWIKFNSLTDTDYGIVTKGGIDTNNGYALRVSNDSPLTAKSLSFWIKRNAAFGIASYPISNLSTGIVYHVVGTYDGRYAKLYVDGVLVSTNDAGAVYAITYVSSNSLMIGAQGGTTTAPSGQYLSADLDELSVYTSALSQEAILNRYILGVNRASYREDPMWDKTLVLMHLNGIPGETGFVDAKGRVVTAIGNVVHSTAQSKFGNCSAYFDGFGDYLQLPFSSDFAFGTGDFTVECWAYQTNTNLWRITNRAEWTAVAGTWGFNITPTSVAFTQVIATEVGVSITGLTTVANTWAHYAACRAKGVLRLYRNGTLVATGMDSQNFSNATYSLKIGVSDATTFFQGYLDEIRITKGARYCTETILISPEKHPERSVLDQSLDAFWLDHTLLMMHFENNFNDSKGRSVTTIGTPTISAVQNKIGTTSGYFNGTTDSLIISGPNFSAGDFTVEAWVYLEEGTAPMYSGGVPLAHTFINLVSGIVAGLNIYFDRVNTTTFKLKLGNGSSLVDSGENEILIPSKTWTHIAVTLFTNTAPTEVINTVTAYVNGAQTIKAFNVSFYEASNWQIGKYLQGDTVSYGKFYGYIDELRITDVCRYFSSFAPPKLAYPDDGIGDVSGISGSGVMQSQNALMLPEPLYSSVKLLIQPSGVDGSTVFTDQSLINQPISRLGNAQVDLGVLIGNKPTLLCDGVGDYLSIADNAEMEPGANDFTIECWFRTTVVTGAQIIVAKRATSATYAPVVITLSGAVVQFYTSTNGTGWTASDTSAGTVAANTTYHLAFERFGSTLKMYLNGVETGTAAVTGTLIKNTAAWLYGSDSNQSGFKGNLGPVRMTFGTARYQGAFTPPEVPFPALTS